MFDYGMIMVLSRVTLNDCLLMFEGGKRAIINDDEIVNFEEDED